MSERVLLNDSRRRKIRTLNRRAEHVRDRMAQSDGFDPGDDYDRAELAALEFALETIHEVYGPPKATP